MFLYGALYGLMLSFTCNENVPLKYSMPEETAVNSCCIDFAHFAL